MNFVFVTIYFLFLFSFVEILSRKYKPKSELSRKFIHIVSGVAVAGLPLILTFREIQFLSALFILFMIISKNINIYKSIHSVERKTLGEIYFPISVLLLATFFPNTFIFSYGLLVMAFSDGFASLFGQKFGIKKYKIISEKSFIGSYVFFVTTFIITFLLLQLLSFNAYDVFLISLIFSIILTFCEAVLGFGIDNLIIPLLAAILMNLIK